MTSKKKEDIRESLYQGSDGKHYTLYNLVDMHGGGDLIPWMRYAMKTGDFSLLDGYLEGTVRDMMYNNGKGRIESTSELVKRRNKERNERLGAFSRKKGKGKSGPNILDNLDGDVNQQDLKKALKLLDGGKGGKGDAKYREIAWKYEYRGSMGETLVGCCLMQGTLVHNLLALRLMEMYPPLINDIFISEDYYGLSPVHQAIVNDDPKMLLFLIQHGADINQRCYGAFFCPDDQISSRTDSLEHEYVDVDEETNYQNRMYFGEYPLSFAACINNVDCFKLLRAKRADPNKQDTNGNTVLHMAVIHENIDMFLLAYESGAKLQVLNKRNLTPLTLSAFLAKKTMFEHLLKIESQILWERGGAVSVSYPLAKIDSIDQDTGDLNDYSVLSLVVYGSTTDHLNLIDGLLEDILNAKWRSFGLAKWTKSLMLFTVYWIIFISAFLTRPMSMTTAVISNFKLTPDMLESNITDSQYNYTFAANAQCHLIHYSDQGEQGYARMGLECLTIVLAVYQIALQASYIRAEGFSKWWKIMQAFPAKIMFFISLTLVILLIPIRFFCFVNEVFLTADNVISIISVMLCTVHYLYYCRAIKFIGPFVLMIYTIIMRDLIRFFLIYFVFLLGFSQAFYVVFLAGERINNIVYAKEVEQWNLAHANNDTSDYPVKHENIMSNPVESFVRLFICTIGEFTVFYKELNSNPVAEMAVLGKILFLIFEIVVSLMQFNLLIAMMSRTYELIFRTQKEYKRQFAQVILLLEMSLTAEERRNHLLRYSRPIGTDKRKRAFVVIKKSEVLTESERILKMKEEEAKRFEKQQFLKRRLRGWLEHQQGAATPLPGGDRQPSRAATKNRNTLKP